MTSAVVGRSQAALVKRLGRLLMGALPEPDVDWAAMVDVARRHGVSALLYWRLPPHSFGSAQDRPSPPLPTVGMLRDLPQGERGQVAGEPSSVLPADPVPGWVREALHEDFYAAAVQSMVAERQLAQVLEAFAGAGVRVLVIKGAALGAFYPDTALRSYGDLDVMVPRAQVERAEETLQVLGYQCCETKEWRLEQHFHLPPMRGSDGQLTVEVHWRLDDLERIGHLPTEELWQRAVPWSVGGQPTLRLDAVDTALHLCRHAVVQHRVRLGLRPLCDLAYVMEDWEQAEWETLAPRARAYGLERATYFMLSLVEWFLGVETPHEVVEALVPAADESIQTSLLERFLGLDLEPSAALPSTAVRAWAKGTRRERLAYFVSHLFLSRAGMEALYHIPAHSARIWLTYLLHPIALLRRYGKASWAVLRHDQAARAVWDREVWLERWLRGGDEEERGRQGERETG
jgi:hypothetical protein